MGHQQQEVRRERQHGRMRIEGQKESEQGGRDIAFPAGPEACRDGKCEQTGEERIDGAGEPQHRPDGNSPQQVDRRNQGRFVEPCVPIQHRAVLHLKGDGQGEVLFRPQDPGMRQVSRQ